MNAGNLPFRIDHAAWRQRLPGVLARLPGLASAALVILIAWVLADLVWRLVPAPPLPQAAPAAGPAGAPAGPGNPGRDINQLIALHLFGVPEAPAEQQAEALDAPETRLNLTLRGVLAAGEPAFSRAIIASGNEERLYPVGASVPGGATIHSILPDRVILRRAGKLEALSLPRESGADVGFSYANGAGRERAEPEPEPTVNRFRRPVADEPPADLDELREALREEPARLLEIARPQPVYENERLVGYRLQAGGADGLLENFGLQSGDLVTAVNGQPLGDPGTSIRLLRELDSDQPVALTVVRDGRTQQITISPTR